MDFSHTTLLVLCKNRKNRRQNQVFERWWIDAGNNRFTDKREITVLALP